eukprot:TRINITY_DN2251_c0_g1_i1.p1 TRINITY_DN2251_c0_g1~~TRINITY_DN2251_c0_g1_i1.p1  ORF type:complete len:176 (-),score=59.40 TRINITY_DN2251_c0_g1_i1:106-633(-)
MIRESCNTNSKHKITTTTIENTDTASPPPKKTKSDIEQAIEMDAQTRNFFTSLLSIQDLLDGEDEDAIKRSVPVLTSDLVELVEDIKWDFLCIEELADHVIMQHFANILTNEPRVLFTDDEHYGDDDSFETETSDIQYTTTQTEEGEEESGSEKMGYSWDWSKQKMTPTPTTKDL